MKLKKFKWLIIYLIQNGAMCCKFIGPSMILVKFYGTFKEWERRDHLTWANSMPGLAVVEITRAWHFLNLLLYHPLPLNDLWKNVKNHFVICCCFCGFYVAVNREVKKNDRLFKKLIYDLHRYIYIPCMYLFYSVHSEIKFSHRHCTVMKL